MLSEGHHVPEIGDLYQDGLEKIRVIREYTIYPQFPFTWWVRVEEGPDIAYEYARSFAKILAHDGEPENDLTDNLILLERKNVVLNNNLE